MQKPNEVEKCYDCNIGLTKEQLEASHNKKYKQKLCDKCMSDFCDHAITGN